MAQEYRHKKAVSNSAQSRKLLLPICGSFLVGYFVASFISFKQLSNSLSDYLVTTGTKTHSKPAKKITELPKPKFEFYNMLTGENVAVNSPVVVAKPIHSQPVTTTSPVTTTVPVNASVPVAIAAEAGKKSNYILQIASFKAKQDADRLKASLLLKGYDATITLVSAQNTKWYRVTVGPLESVVTAEKAQSSIARSEKLMGMIRKMEG